MGTRKKPDNTSVRYCAPTSPVATEPHLRIAPEPPTDEATVNVRLLEVLSSIDHHLKRQAADTRRLARNTRRIADALDPTPPEIVGTPYVAHKLDCTTTWIADLIRQGEIPARCIVPGTGNGKLWKFYRARIDEWIASR